MEIIQLILPLIIFILLCIPMGSYLYKVISGEKSFVDAVFDKIDNFIYRVVGIKKEEMTWKKYAVSLITVNIIMGIFAYLVLRLQGINLFNPSGVTAMSPALALNTAVSFITNTNLQNYAGETGVSYLSQSLVMTFLMFTSAASGFAVAAAFMRGIAGKQKTFGNFFVDTTRIITRVLLPFSFVITLALVAQGVPQNFNPTKTVTTIENTRQDIAMGPVASLEAIKHLGTNGGGFYNANSAHPFENPTPISNLIELLSMMLLPGSFVVAFGIMLRNRKQGWAIFIAMLVLFLITLPIIYFAEKAGNPRLTGLGLSNLMGNMEGKELRFGIGQSSLFTAVTTAFTTGSVNSMLDSLMPLGGFVALWNMMLNVVFGGKGVGFMNMAMYIILTVFLSGLMVGRTPEFLGKKIEAKEIKLVALGILIHPIIILFPSAIAVLTKVGQSALGNSGFHGLTEIVYQYTTAAANNGSSFAGLSGNTIFWNVTTAIVMIIGRYFSMIILLAVAGSLATKQSVPESTGTFRTDNSTFVVLLICIVIIVGALTFLPALALGPIAEHLTIGR